MNFAQMLMADVEPLFTETDKNKQLLKARMNMQQKAINRYKTEFLHYFDKQPRITGAELNQMANIGYGKHILKRMEAHGLIKVAVRGKSFVYEKA